MQYLDVSLIFSVTNCYDAVLTNNHPHHVSQCVM